MADAAVENGKATLRSRDHLFHTESTDRSLQPAPPPPPHPHEVCAKSPTWWVTMVTRGLSRFSQDGICPLVTMKIFRTHGACLSMDLSEYLSSSLSSKRLADTSSSCLDWEMRERLDT